MSQDDSYANAIAIIGMSGRFPGAGSCDAFWENLINGRESITFFSDDELERDELDFHSVRDDLNYVRARGVLEGIDLFDAGFFGFNPREASILDPQHRIWLECVWESLEQAGYDPEKYDGVIGLYAGGSFLDSYLLHNICRNHEHMERLIRMRSPDAFATILSNCMEFMTTRTSHRLNLKGPSVNVQTGCSTSLVAVYHACQSLLHYDSDICLAGGVSVIVPQKSGYLYREGAISSPDGHCRSFDAGARGTVFSNGVGVVVLKRLEDALADSDNIIAVIRGIAVNNDGSEKIGFTAPGVTGQAEVIAMAHAAAEVDPETISYVEAHGTATPLGDPIEISALTKAFRIKTDARQFCGIGSVKSNIGHLDAAAGVAGLIKTALALQHRRIPASLHYKSPNPEIDFENSPFYVVNRRTDWATDHLPRRAGVSAFGIGGSNAHAVLEEAPEVPPSGESRPWKLILLSAKTESSLESRTAQLAEYLKENERMDLGDVAYTLQVGRQDMTMRRAFVCRDGADAVRIIGEQHSGRIKTRRTVRKNMSVVFMFSGQGSQHINMGRGLYECEPVFKTAVDSCSEILKPHLALDIRNVMFPGAENETEAARQLNQTRLTQPALFVTEYALAQLWQAWGIRPDAMIGHSLGEYVAATLAGVFSLEDALAIVAARAALMQEMPAGSMRAVRLSAHELESHLSDGVSLAAVNAPSLCVVSGGDAAIDAFDKALNGQGVDSIRLHTSHAFHSEMMEPALAPFLKVLNRVRLQPPKMPFISNVTGTWITKENATDPGYWGRQLRQPVLFSDGIRELQKVAGRVLLEVGPGTALSTSARQHNTRAAEQTVVSSLGHAKESLPSYACILKALGEVWLSGCRVDWEGFYRTGTRRRVPLPTYPFERKSYWIEPAERVETADERDFSLPRAEVETVERAFVPHTEERVDAILVRLKESVHELSGIDFDGFDASASFLEMGMDSLFLTQVSNRLKTEFGISLGFRRLVGEFSTFPSLAAYIDEKLPEKALADHGSPEEPGSGGDRAPDNAGGEADRSFVEHQPEVFAFPRFRNLPLSSTQRRLWYVDQLNPGSPLYNLPFAFRFLGRVDADILKRSLYAVINRHESLRTTFHVEGEFPVQVVAERLEIEVPVIDFSHFSKEERENRLDDYLHDEAARPFDLQEGPLVRAGLVCMTGEETVLFFMPHHIVFDGISFGIFQRELFEYYEAFKNDRPAKLPVLPVQYADYSAWQQEWLHGEGYKRQMAYWTKQLSGRLPTLQMPADLPRPAAMSNRGATVTVTVPDDLVQSLADLARNEEATLFMVFLAAYKVLLFRYSGQRDICIGSPFSNRIHKETEGLLGFFTNTVVLRTALDARAGFRDLLKRVKQVCLEASGNQELPFDHLVQELNPQRGLSVTPLYQAMFVFRGEMDFTSTMDNVVWRLRPIPPRVCQTDLVCSIGKSARGMEVNFEYSTDLFQAGTVERWLNNYLVLLEGIARKPECEVGLLPLLTRGEQERMALWNCTDSDYPREASIQELFEAQVEKKFNVPAVTFEGVSLSYCELNKRANQLAHYLKALGVQPGAMVGLCCERSLEMVVGIIGILKAGAAYVPLDPGYPEERLRYMLDDTRAPVLIVEQGLRDNFPDYEGQLIGFDSDRFIIAGQSEQNPVAGSSPENRAYVMYTSGSTGKPKGIEVTHRNVIRLVKNTNYATLDEKEVILQYAPISFDAATFEIWGALLNGGRVVVCPAGQISFGELGRIIERNGVTTVWLTSGLFHNIVENDLGCLRSVRQILSGGDVLAPASVKKVLSEHEDTCVINAYGPTENTTFTCCYPMTGVDQVGMSVSIGRPISNTRIYILDEHMNQVPVGVAGELYTSGDGVALGYLNRPELTEKAFRSDPFSGEPDSRLYRTGDLARYLPDGRIEFLGRIDRQVKIRGYRIELGDIESVLSSHESVRQVVVMAREDRSGDKRLTAYFVADASVKDHVGQLRGFLQEKLPDYMIPQYFIRMDAIPITANGKTDRDALPAPSLGNMGTVDSYTAPRTRTETEIARIWRQVIGLEKISVTDNFFEIGGHSLLAVTMFSKLSHQYGVNLPLATLFSASTIETLAQIIDGEVKDEAGLTGKPESVQAVPFPENGDCVKGAWIHLVTIQSHGKRPPFFCMHAVGGNVLNYYAFVPALGPDQPLYGLQSRGLDGISEPYGDIETMARKYIEEMRVVQPHGPYYLGGGSMGGLIALEVARQLKAAGEKIAFLAMFDTFAPSYFDPEGYKPNRIFSKDWFKQVVSSHIPNLVRQSPSKQVAYVYVRILNRILNRMKLLGCKMYHVCGRPIPHGLRYWYVEYRNMKPAFTYSLKQYEGKLTLFSDSSNSSGENSDMEKGWGEFISGEIEVVGIPADHYEFVEDKLVGEKLDIYLRKAQQEQIHID